MPGNPARRENGVRPVFCASFATILIGNRDLRRGRRHLDPGETFRDRRQRVHRAAHRQRKGWASDAREPTRDRSAGVAPPAGLSCRCRAAMKADVHPKSFLQRVQCLGRRRSPVPRIRMRGKAAQKQGRTGDSRGVAGLPGIGSGGAHRFAYHGKTESFRATISSRAGRAPMR